MAGDGQVRRISFQSAYRCAMEKHEGVLADGELARVESIKIQSYPRESTGNERCSDVSERPPVRCRNERHCA